MAKAGKKTLPKDIDAMRAVFDQCDIDTLGGYAKRAALAFGVCLDRLSRCPDFLRLGRLPPDRAGLSSSHLSGEGPT